MKQSCYFDENRDIMAVVPDMATDVDDAIETGVVRDTGIDSFDNGLDDVSGIICRVEDSFQAIDHQRTIGKMLKAARDKAAALAAPAAAPAAAVSTPEGGEAN